MPENTHISKLKELTIKIQEAEDVALQLKDIRIKFSILESSISEAIIEINRKIKEFAKETV